MSDAVDTLIVAQDELIAALDRGDVGDIEAATRALASALPAVRAAAADDRIVHASKQSEAARLRVNFLTDRTAQKLARLAELRGEPGAVVYRARPHAGVRTRLA